jgi:rubrerythrin
MDIFEFAMEKEKDSRDFYHQLAEKSTDKGLAKIFNMLAGEEEKHYRIVEQMKNNVPQEVGETDFLSDAKDIFKQMKKGAGKFSFSASQTDIYKKAQAIEKQSREFYLQKVDEVKDALQKKIFTQLAAEENKHYFLLENILDFVSRPEQWLENAEWYHLDKY